MLKVVSINQKPQEDKAPVVNEWAVQYLKETLALAESGSITDIAIIFREKDESISTVFDGANRFALLGGIEYMAHRLKNLIGES